MTVRAVERPLFGTTGHRLTVTAPYDAAAEVSAWIRTGVERGERVVVLGSAPAVAADVEHLPPGDVLAGPALDALLAGALRRGRTGLRLVLEVEAGLEVFDPPAYEGFETLLDGLCRDRPLSVLCCYDPRHTVGAVMRGAVAAHAAGVRDGRVTTALSPSGVLLVDGEVDAANGEAFGAAVAAAADRTREGDVLELDLSSTTFMGSAGVRALLLGSREHRDRGGLLVLGGALEPVERVLRTCAIDTVPGVRLTEGAR